MRKRFGLLDSIVTLLCLSGASLMGYLFWEDLNQSLTKNSEVPIGTIVYKRNGAQRRFKDRLAWGSVQKDTPVYNGDLIRTADYSGAVITFANKDSVNIAENSLIQLFYDPGRGARLALSGGNIVVDAKEKLNVVSAGLELTVSPGATASVGAGTEDLAIQVLEGTAQVSAGNEVRELRAGTGLNVDPAGRVEVLPQVVVTAPLPNQTILLGDEPSLGVSFSYQTANFPQGEWVRLDIAADRHFSPITLSLDDPANAGAAVDLSPGVWWWRAYPAKSREAGRAAAAAGKLTILRAPIPEPLFPAEGARYTYVSAPPEIRFRWRAPPPPPGAGEPVYELTVADNPDMRGPRIRAVVNGFSYTAGVLGPGTWYWQVRPQYPGDYQGMARASRPASLAVEQQAALASPALLFPEPDSVIATEDRELRFSWKREGAAALYTITVLSAGEPDTPVIRREVTDTFYTHNLRAAPLSAGVYIWSVSCRDAGGNASPLSPPRMFTAAALPPPPAQGPEAAPVLEEPFPSAEPAETAPPEPEERAIPSGALFPPHDYSVQEAEIPNLAVTWEMGPQGETRFQLAGGPDFSKLLLDAPLVNGGRPLREQRLSPGTYYWRITARIEGMGDRVLTQGRRLVVTGLLAAPKAEAPSGRVLRDPQRDLVFRWRPVPGAASYSFALYRGSPPGTGGSAGRPLQEQTTAANYLALPIGPLEPGAYYWTVRAARDAQGNRLGEGPGEITALSLENPRRARLESPAAFPGIQIQRQGGAVRWSSAEIVGSARFILSRDPNPLTSNPVVTLDNPPWNIPLPRLAEGTYYWTIRAQTPEGVDISAGEPAGFRVLPVSLPKVVLESPETISGLESQRRIGTVRWSSIETVGNSRFILSRNPNPLSANPLMSLDNPPRMLTLPALDEGTYYWTIQAYTPDGFDISAPRPGSFRVLPLSIPAVVLESPAAVPGLDALRLGITVQWRSVEIVGRSWFILSQDPNPAAGNPLLRIENPPRSVNLPALDEGTYYWIIQAQTPDGLDISPRRAASFQVLPIPLLDAPREGMPAGNTLIDPDYIRLNRIISFSWNEVAGANAYGFTLFRSGLQEPLIHIPALSQTGYRLEDPSLLENGDYIWRVEALYRAVDGRVIQQGNPGEFRFTLSIPPPEAPAPRQPGILYGF
jgi:hypothetical protein